MPPVDQGSSSARDLPASVPLLPLPPLGNLAAVCRVRVLIAVSFGLGMVRGPVACVAESFSAIPPPDRGLSGPREVAGGSRGGLVRPDRRSAGLREGAKRKYRPGCPDRAGIAA